MANPFDQFDGAQAPQAVAQNPFDAFDNQAEAASPTENQILGEKVKSAAPDLSKVPVGSSLSIDNLKRGLGVLFSKVSPWERYKQSVDQAFESNLPEVHRYEAPTGEGVANRTLQTAAGVENVANSVSSGAISPGGASMINPITAGLAAIYATPRIIGGGIESLMNIGKDKTVQQNVESGLGGVLGVLGGAAGGIHGVKGLKAQMPKAAPIEVPKGPSLVEQMDGDTHGTPSAANLAANEIAMKPIEPVTAPASAAPAEVPSAEPKAAPAPADVAIDTINKGILESAPKSESGGFESTIGSEGVVPYQSSLGSISHDKTVKVDKISERKSRTGKRIIDFHFDDGVTSGVQVEFAEGEKGLSPKEALEHALISRGGKVADAINPKPNSAHLVETKLGNLSRTDKANYDAYVENLPIFEEAHRRYLDNPEDPKAEADYLKAANKNEELKNKNGGYAPESPVESGLPEKLKGEGFEEAWKEGGGLRGNENQIVIDGDVVYKRNYSQMVGKAMPKHADRAAFDRSIELHNEIFPETRLDIVGDSPTSDGPAPVTRQDRVTGRPASTKELRDYMAERGFEPNGGDNFINRETGVKVEDLHNKNVFVDDSGQVRVIDPVIKETKPASKAKAMPEVKPEVKPAERTVNDTASTKSYLDELLATKEITPEEHAARLSEIGETPKSKPITVPAVTPLDFVIPKELSKSNPRYKASEVSFENPLDKALYIIAQEAKRSARDSDFLDLVMEHTGMSEAEARSAGQEVRDRIKQLSDSSKAGEPLTLESNAIPKQSAKSVPIPSQAKAGEGVGSQVRSGVSESPGAREDSLFPKEKTVAQDTSAAEQPPKVLQELVSPKDLQHLADDLDVHQILADIEANAPANEGSSPIAEGLTRLITGASEQETAPRVGGRPPMPPIGNNGNNHQGAGGQPYKPGLTSLPIGLGKIAEAAKIIAGTIEGNIRDASKKVFGVLRNYEYAKSKLSQQFQQATLPASRLARKILTKEGNDIVGNLLMSGKIDEAKALVAKETRYGKEFSAAIDAVRKALDYSYKVSSEARDGAVNYVKDYFPRQMIDYAEFRKFLGKDEQSVADKAIKRAQDASKTPLTPEQIEAVMADLISQSRRGGGKPGFLKPRTVAEIDSNISKFYEPWDVALENHLNRVVNDVVDRAYLGKFDPTQGALWDPANGHFGKVLAEEVASGRLSPKAANIVIDNLQDRFKLQGNVSQISMDIGRKIRFAQSAAYLGQLQTAVAQFGDVFGSILHQGIVDTAKGYASPRFKLSDIGIHEGNVETAQFSRRKGLIDKAADLTIKFGVGLSDQFNKGGVANAIARHYADVVKAPMSDAFAHLNRDYSAKFPDQWPKMLKELQSRAFANGDIKELPNAQFFLYNEMADIHPINPSGMAQGFNAAHPLAKPFWGLKSYMIKQLDIMRARGYEKIKDTRTRGEGLAYLAAYAAVVAAGQNFAVSWLRDKLANRETDTSDYFIGGFLQPLGISRYTITQLKQGEVGKAMIETALPIVSLGREAINDVSLVRDLVAGRRDKKTQLRTVKDIGDLMSQSELVKHFPVIGSLYYSRAGKGAANEQKRNEQKAKGREQPNTFDTFRTIVAPNETTRN